MKIKIILIFISINVLTLQSQVTVDWIERTLGSPDSMGYPMTLYPDFGESLIKLDPYGNVITSGTVTYTIYPFITGPDSVYVAKYDNGGSMIWYKTFPGGEAIVYFMDIDTSGNIFLIANIDEDT